MPKRSVLRKTDLVYIEEQELERNEKKLQKNLKSVFVPFVAADCGASRAGNTGEHGL